MCGSEYFPIYPQKMLTNMILGLQKNKSSKVQKQIAIIKGQEERAGKSKIAVS
jgi:hypothetical protein